MKKNKFIAMFTMLLIAIATILATAPKTYAYNDHEWASYNGYKYLLFASGGFEGRPDNTFNWNHAVPSDNETYIAPADTVLEYQIDGGDWIVAGETITLSRRTNYPSVGENEHWNLAPGAELITPSTIISIRYKVPIVLIPGISGNEHFVTEVDNIRPVSFFIDQLVAYDDYDGDISHLIEIESDNFTGKTALGQYQVDVYVIDSSDNRSDFTFYVHIVDNTAPSISGDFSKKTISYDKTFDLAAFLNSLTVTDNHYLRNELEVKVSKDNYTVNKNKVGTYLVEIEASDPSLNNSKIEFYIEVKDLVKPVFSGLKSYSKSFNKIVTAQEIIQDITANDYIDGDLTSEIQIVEDTFTGNSNLVGNYRIILAATDSAGNQALHTVNVAVLDEDGADWYVVDGTSINLEEGSTMTRAQIIALLAKIDLIEATTNSIITYSVDTYSNNVGETGIYRLAFNVTQPDGTSNDYEYTVNVGDVNTDDADVLPGDKDSFLFRNSAVIVIVLITIAAGTIIYLKFNKK